jgi:hypothetical protein
MWISKPAILPLILAVVAAPFAARGDDLPPQDLGAHITPSGFDFIAAEVPRALPHAFNVEGFTQQLVDCPFTDHNTDLTVDKIKTAVSVQSLQLTPQSGRLGVKLRVNVSGLASLTVTRPYACVGYPLTCQVGFQVRDATATARFSPALVSGRVRLHDPELELQLPKEKVEINLSGCGLASSLGNLVLPLFKGHLVSRVSGNLQALALEQVPPQVEALLAGLTEVSGDLPEGLSVRGALNRLHLSPSGLSLGASVAVSTLSASSCPLEPAPAIAPTSSAPAFAASADEQFGVALGRAPIERALQTIWRAGHLCAGADRLRELGLPSELPGWGKLLIGLQGTTSLELHGHGAPRVELQPGAGARVRVTLPGLRLVIAGTGAKGPTTVTASMTLELVAAVRIDPPTRAVVLETVSTGFEELAVTASDDSGLRLQPALLATLIRGVVAPIIEKNLTGLELLPQVLHQSGGLLDPFFLNLHRAVTSTEHLSLYASLFRRPDFDQQPPSVSFAAAPPARTAEPAVTLQATGSDDRTPVGLLRYRFRLDGGAWSAPRYSPLLRLELEEGEHSVELQSIDLNDNASARPASARITMDPSYDGKGDAITDPDAEASSSGCSAAPAHTRAAGPGAALLLLLLAVSLALRPRRR